MPIKIPTLYRFQHEIINDPSQIKVCCAGRQIGKSWVSKVLCAMEALKGGYILYLAPDNKSLLPHMKDLHELIEPIVIGYNKSSKIITTNTGAVIEFFSCDKKNVVRGRSATLVVVDECSHIPNLMELWESEIEATLSTTRGKVLFISTPRGKGNDFYKLWQMGNIKNPQRDVRFKSWHFTQQANPKIPKDILERNLAKTDAISRQEYRGEFLDAGCSPFSYDALDKCLVNEMSNEEPVCYGIDVGLQIDETYISGLDKDGKLCRVYGGKQGSSSDITRWILEHIGTKIPTIIDSTGVGYGILTNLQETITNVEPFVFSGKSRQQLLESYADAINENKTTINKQLKDELERFGISTTINGQRYEQIGKKSDDLTMATALAWHCYLHKFGSTPKIQTFTPNDFGIRNNNLSSIRARIGRF